MQIVTMLLSEVLEFVPDSDLNSYRQNARLARELLGPDTILITKSGPDIWAVGPDHPTIPVDSILYFSLHPAGPNKVVARLYDNGYIYLTEPWGIPVDLFEPSLRALKGRAVTVI